MKVMFEGKDFEDVKAQVFNCAIGMGMVPAQGELTLVPSHNSPTIEERAAKLEAVAAVAATPAPAEPVATSAAPAAKKGRKSNAEKAAEAANLAPAANPPPSSNPFAQPPTAVASPTQAPAPAAAVASPFSTPAAASVASQPVPAAAPAPAATIEDQVKATLQEVNAKKSFDHARNALLEFGAQKFSDLPAAKYPEFIDHCKKLLAS